MKFVKRGAKYEAWVWDTRFVWNGSHTINVDPGTQSADCFEFGHDEQWDSYDRETRKQMAISAIRAYLKHGVTS